MVRSVAVRMLARVPYFRQCKFSFNTDSLCFSSRQSCIWPLQGIEEALPRSLSGHLGKLRRMWAGTRHRHKNTGNRGGGEMVSDRKECSQPQAHKINGVVNPLGFNSEKRKLISLVRKWIRIWLSKHSFAPHFCLPKIKICLTGRHRGIWELSTQVSKAFLKYELFL